MIIDSNDDEAGAYVQAAVLAQAKEYLEACLCLCIVGQLDKDEALDRIMECASTYPGWDDNEELAQKIHEWLKITRQRYDLKLFQDSVLTDISELPEIGNINE